MAWGKWGVGAGKTVGKGLERATRGVREALAPETPAQNAARLSRIQRETLRNEARIRAEQERRFSAHRTDTTLHPGHRTILTVLELSSCFVITAVQYARRGASQAAASRRDRANLPGGSRDKQAGNTPTKR